MGIANLVMGIVLLEVDRMLLMIFVVVIITRCIAALFNVMTHLYKVKQRLEHVFNLNTLYFHLTLLFTYV